MDLLLPVSRQDTRLSTLLLEEKSKERVTINAYANATGTIKLPLQLTGKAKCPRCFRGLRMDLLPVEYCGQKNARMSSEIFHALFLNSFIPTLRKELSSLGLELKAVVVLDNCPVHPKVMMKTSPPFTCHQMSLS